MDNYMTNAMGLQGVGAYVDIDPDQPWLGTKWVDDPPESGKSGGGGFANTVNAIANLFSSATDAITKITTRGGGGGMTYTPPPGGSGAGAGASQPSFLQQHGGKLLIGGLALGAGYLAVRALSGKKKK